jgi:acetyltransferase
MARLTQIDYDREMAFIATVPGPDGEEETQAVVRTVANADNTKADFAVMVRSDLKRAGLGSALMKKMIEYCRSRGLKEIVGQLLADNEAMQSLTAKLGFKSHPLPQSDEDAKMGIRRCEVRLKLD